MLLTFSWRGGVRGTTPLSTPGQGPRWSRWNSHGPCSVGDSAPTRRTSAPLLTRFHGLEILGPSGNSYRLLTSASSLLWTTHSPLDRSYSSFSTSMRAGGAEAYSW